MGDLSGGACLGYGGDSPFVTLPCEDAGGTFVVNAGQNEFYEDRFICAAAEENVDRSPLRVRLNGELLTELPRSWVSVRTTLNELTRIVHPGI